MLIDHQAIAYAVRHNDVNSLLRAGINDDDFEGEARTAWKYLKRMQRTHDALPSRDAFHSRFPDVNLPKVRKSELPMIIDNLKRRTKFIRFMTALNNIARESVDYENVNEKIQRLVGELNVLAYEDSEKSHLVDLFSPEARELLIADIKSRRSGKTGGIPTGFRRFDLENGGLEPGKMVVGMGRTGVGKSWADLAIAANAVLYGASVVLYPLEMSVAETAYRLYSIFSNRMWGANKAIKNLDITRGHVPIRKVVKLMQLLEDKFPGQLVVADVASLADPYTMERIEAETSALKPHMIWIDYITLVKPPPGSKEDQHWIGVQRLSNSLQQIAKRRNVVGGCSAQVNREALKVKAFLPRPEHISFGDAIGQDADFIFSFNRKGNDLYYAVVKARGGVEIPQTRVRFSPNIGLIKEYKSQEGDDDA